MRALTSGPGKVKVIGNHSQSDFAGAVQGGETWRVSAEESGGHREGYFCLFLNWDIKSMSACSWELLSKEEKP